MTKETRLRTGLVVSLLLAGFVIFSFQNCGQTTVVSNSATAASTSNASSTNGASLTPCVASGCDEDAGYLQTQILNANPITYLASGSKVTETAIDISGYCNIAGFPTSHIYYSIQDNNGNLVVPITQTSATCDMLGRFKFSLGIGSLSGSTAYQLFVIVRAVDSTGVEFDNPVGLNKKQVGLSPTTGT